MRLPRRLRGACSRLADASCPRARAQSRRRTFVRRARPPVASRDVRDPRGRIQGRPSRVRARLSRGFSRHAAAGACAGRTHAAARVATQRRRLTRTHGRTRTAACRRRRACNRRRRTQERNQRDHDQAARVQRTRRRVASRSGRQRRSQARSSRGAKRRGRQGAVEILIMCETRVEVMLGASRATPATRWRAQASRRTTRTLRATAEAPRRRRVPRRSKRPQSQRGRRCTRPALAGAA